MAGILAICVAFMLIAMFWLGEQRGEAQAEQYVRTVEVCNEGPLPRRPPGTVKPKLEE